MRKYIFSSYDILNNEGKKEKNNDFFTFYKHQQLPLFKFQNWIESSEDRSICPFCHIGICCLPRDKMEYLATYEDNKATDSTLSFRA